MDDYSDIIFAKALTSFKFDIVPSRIATGGFGLAAAAVIPAAEDIFRKDQLLTIPDKNHLVSTCDHCFRWLGDSINVQGRMYDATNNPAVLKRCSGCRKVRYCSGVSYLNYASY